MAILHFIGGLAALLIGAELLVRSAGRLSLLLGLSPLVVGLTIVSFGTSAPEIGVGLLGSISGETDVGLGNIIGSNIFNILFILGLAALITPLSVQRKVVRIDVPIMIAAGLLIMLMSLNGVLGLFDGIVLLVLLVAYTAFTIHLAQEEREELRREYAARQTETDASPRRTATRAVSILVLSLAMLAFGANWVVVGATELAAALGVSSLVIGLTITAFGTSLPEVVTSVVAAVRGQQDIAVGNVVGSCLFNLLAVGGIMAVTAPGGVPVAAETTFFDMPVMVAASIACFPIFFTGGRISRWEGGFMFAYYFAYGGLLILSVIEHESLSLFSPLTLAFVVPLVAITVLAFWWRSPRRRIGKAGGTTD